MTPGVTGSVTVNREEEKRSFVEGSVFPDIRLLCGRAAVALAPHGQVIPLTRQRHPRLYYRKQVFSSFQCSTHKNYNVNPTTVDIEPEISCSA